MSAETLALMSAQEESMYLQSFLYELLRPGKTAIQLLAVPGDELCPVDAATDCGDLYESLVQPAAPTPTNRSVVLYLAALREAKQTRRVRSWLWVDTEDNVSNSLTKLCADGTLPAADMSALLKHSFWEPIKVYRWNGLLTSPSAPKHIPCIVNNPPPKATTTTTTTTTNDDDSNHAASTTKTAPTATVYAPRKAYHAPSVFQASPSTDLPCEPAYDWACTESEF